MHSRHDKPYDKLALGSGPVYGSARILDPVIRWDTAIERLPGTGSIKCFTDGAGMEKRGVAPDGFFKMPVGDYAFGVVMRPSDGKMGEYARILREHQDGLSDDMAAVSVSKI